MTNVNNILLDIALYGCARSKGIKRKKPYVRASKMIMLSYDRRKRKCLQNTLSVQTDKKSR